MARVIALANPPRRIRRELVPAAAHSNLSVPFMRPDIALLDQVQELQAAVGLLLGDGHDEAQDSPPSVLSLPGRIPPRPRPE